MVGFAKPICDRSFNLVAVPDVDEVNDLCFGGAVGTADLGRFYFAVEENTDFEVAAFGADEEIAGTTREHDGFVGCIDALIAEGELVNASPTSSASATGARW